MLWTSNQSVVIFRRHFHPAELETVLSLRRTLSLWLASALTFGAVSAGPIHAQTTAAAATTTAPSPAPGFKLADLPNPPIDSRDKFVAYMTEKRHEDPKMLAWRFDRAQAMIENRDVWRAKELKAYLLTPREEFVLERNHSRAYDHAFLDIGYGVTISGPHLVGRMTSTIDVQPGERVLEIGTGSGYQSAVLSHLTDQVYTIEIIEPLGKRSAANYQRLTPAGYPEFANVHTKVADGYFGWADAAPFDKIIVTCGIDHIPPPLLQQLKPGGIMVIPVGPPGRQHVLEVKKVADASGNVTVTRRDIYNGKIVNFVPFTKAGGGTW
ncbi:MAG: protein-L-isoaspartate(D-aspartate) O-methyltransferase [Rhodospirillaceae bacterium]|jgi:protein-L-isoaspartate(D-aspartate) O-methyltransferase|nr:protein-L-isoaspartate(D-aspartate) O-methyltransferase [Rhodospirillaceae bacterium]